MLMISPAADLFWLTHLGTLAVGFAAATWWTARRWRRQRILDDERHRQNVDQTRQEAALANRIWQQSQQAELQRLRLDQEADFFRQRQSLEQQTIQTATSLKEIADRQQQLALQTASLDRRTAQLAATEAAVAARMVEYREKIEQLVGTTREEAHRDLIEEVRREVEDELRALKAELLQQGESRLREDARRTLVAAMQRLSASPMHDITATIVPLTSEAMKGRLIGREGRNIKSFESATGVTLLIDETPDSVLISSFDPVRREVARLALLHLMKDGRIHPASIEEAVGQANEQIKQSVLEFGEEALRKTRLSHVHPEVVSLLGKLRFRLSNNQNSLEHSIEVANLCSLLAAELRLDPEIARRAGLFHDIGKSIEDDLEGSHAMAAAQLLKRHGENPIIVNAVASHHQEVQPESTYAVLVMIADSISAVRPGARSESIHSYLQRVTHLETLAKSFPGVQDAFAIQAGREVRVIVAPERLSDLDSKNLAQAIRHRVEEEMQYPGAIKITVIREQRFTEQAR